MANLSVRPINDSVREDDIYLKLIGLSDVTRKWPLPFRRTGNSL